MDWEHGLKSTESLTREEANKIESMNLKPRSLSPSLATTVEDLENLFLTMRMLSVN